MLPDHILARLGTIKDEIREIWNEIEDWQPCDDAGLRKRTEAILFLYKALARMNGLGNA